ncbi:MAG: hypothetical protein U5N86_01085 [Planctomycetota bacterium]|nr:hypothetical protein [Planctomycetota bacterium]
MKLSLITRLGISYFQQGKYRLTCETLYKALQLDTHYKKPSLLLLLGLSYHFCFEHSKASSCFDDYISLKPRRFEGYLFQAIVSHYLKDGISAKLLVEKAEKFEPKSHYATLVKGKFREIDGDVSGAMEVYQKVLSENQRNKVAGSFLRRAEKLNARMNKGIDVEIRRRADIQ